MRTGTILFVMMLLGVASAVSKKIERHHLLRCASQCEPCPSERPHVTRNTPETRRLDQTLDGVQRNMEAANSAVTYLDQSIRSIEQLVRQAERSRDKAAQNSDPRVVEIYERNLVELNEQLKGTQLQRAKLAAQRDRMKAEQVTLEMRRRLIAEGASDETLKLLELQRPSPVDQLDRVDLVEPTARPRASSVIVVQ